MVFCCHGEVEVWHRLYYWRGSNDAMKFLSKVKSLRITK